jgi:hypothetical protein
MSTQKYFEFTDSAGRLYRVPAPVFEAYSERVTVYTTPDGLHMVESWYPGEALTQRKEIATC